MSNPFRYFNSSPEVRALKQRERAYTFVTRLFRISAANIGPNRFPPKSDRFMADVDPPLGQQILDVAQRQRVPDAHHHDYI